MGKFSERLNTFKSREFELEIYEGRAHLRPPRGTPAHPPDCISKIIEVHDDYVVIETAYLRHNTVQHYFVPIQMIYISD